MFSRRSVALFALSAILLIAVAFADEDAAEPPKPKKTTPPPAKCSFKGNAWKDSLTFSEKMWAGSLARLCAQTLLHPLDTIRTRRQVMHIPIARSIPSRMILSPPFPHMRSILASQPPRQIRCIHPRLASQHLGWTLLCLLARLDPC
jgi:hypothetical protein